MNEGSPNSKKEPPKPDFLADDGEIKDEFSGEHFNREKYDLNDDGKVGAGELGILVDTRSDEDLLSASHHEKSEFISKVAQQLVLNIKKRYKQKLGKEILGFTDTGKILTSDRTLIQPLEFEEEILRRWNENVIVEDERFQNYQVLLTTEPRAKSPDHAETLYNDMQERALQGYVEQIILEKIKQLSELEEELLIAVLEAEIQDLLTLREKYENSKGGSPIVKIAAMITLLNCVIFAGTKMVGVNIDITPFAVMINSAVPLTSYILAKWRSKSLQDMLYKKINLENNNKPKTKDKNF